MQSVKPVILGSASGNITGYETHPMMLHCMNTGDPRPRVTWFKENANIVDSRFKVRSFEF